MFKFTDLEALLAFCERYKEDEIGAIACSLITPSQCVFAYLTQPEKRLSNDNYEVGHADIFNYMLGEMYDIGTDIDMSTKKGREEKDAIIYDLVSGKEDNFISARFIANTIFQITILIFIPYYITPEEYMYLVALNEKLKNRGINISVSVSNYDPIDCYDKKEELMYFEEEGSRINLSLALDFLRKSGRIVDYDLSFGEERIIKSPSVTEEKVI